MPSPSSIVKAALMAGSVASAASVQIEPRQMVTEKCADVHVFLAKGNNEPYPGRQGKLVDAICKGLNSCDYEDIQWRNMGNDEYCGAISEGTANGYAQIQAYNKRCPKSKLVVSGFSQGAHAVGDIFGGGGGSFFNGCQTKATPNIPFNTPAGQAVAAILTFGDVRHTANQPYNYMDGATQWGLFPRNAQQLSNAVNFAGVWRDYCAKGDPICAGGKIVDDHLNYFDLYSNEAAAFVHERLIAAGLGKDNGVTSSAAPVPSATTTKGPSFPSTVPHGNGTIPSSGSASSSTVLTITDTVGATVTIITTVCPNTQSYVPNPTAETKPPHLSVTVPYPLPEATVSTTINLSSIPTAIATGTIPPVNNGTIVVPPKTSSTGSVPIPPATGASAANVAKMGGVVAVAMAAAAALL
jgi:hypothetical protein